MGASAWGIGDKWICLVTGRDVGVRHSVYVCVCRCVCVCVCVCLGERESALFREAFMICVMQINGVPVVCVSACAP